MLPNLKLLRQEYGISQQKLADAIGVSQPSINKYENHSIEPEVEILCRMADDFNTSIDYIVGHTDVCRKIEPVTMYHLNSMEQEWVESLRHLTEEEKNCLLRTAQLLRKQK